MGIDGEDITCGACCPGCGLGIPVGDVTCESCVGHLPDALIVLIVKTRGKPGTPLAAVHDTARRCAAMWFRVHPVVAAAEGAA